MTKEKRTPTFYEQFKHDFDMVFYNINNREDKVERTFAEIVDDITAYNPEYFTDLTAKRVERLLTLMRQDGLNTYYPLSDTGMMGIYPRKISPTYEQKHTNAHVAGLRVIASLPNHPDDEVGADMYCDKELIEMYKNEYDRVSNAN